MLKAEVMVEFYHFLRVELLILLAGDEFRDPLARGPGWLESRDIFRRWPGGDEVDELIVGAEFDQIDLPTSPRQSPIRAGRRPASRSGFHHDSRSSRNARTGTHRGRPTPGARSGRRSGAQVSGRPRSVAARASAIVSARPEPGGIGSPVGIDQEWIENPRR